MREVIIIENRIFITVITVAISIIGYFLKRQVDTNDDMRTEIDELKVRVAINENEVNNTNKLLSSIQDDLKYLVRRVDEIAKG